MSSSERPSGLIADKGIELLTFGTPNGHKVSILLEELKAAYGKDYTFQSINIMENIQKEPWFTKYCPNGRIPVIIDHDRNDFAVFEGLAILTYMCRHYDPEYKFSFKDEDEYSSAEQWMSFQHGGVGPMQGQANHFYRLAKERIPYPTQRYVGETERLYGVLDKRLEGREYLVGTGKGKYSIADIANFSWVNLAYFSGVNLAQFPNLNKWAERIEARPAVENGVNIPNPPRLTNKNFLKNLENDKEAMKAEEERRSVLDKAKEQYSYKFASP